MQNDPWAEFNPQSSAPASYGGMEAVPLPPKPAEQERMALARSSDARAQRAERRAEEAHQRAMNKPFGTGGLGAQAIKDAQTRLNQAMLFRKQLQEVNRLWKKTQSGGGLGGLVEYLPTPQNKAFDKAAAGLKSIARTLFKTPGDQMTEFEGKPIMEMIPDRWSFDEANIQAINQLDSLAREIIGQNAAILGKRVRSGGQRQSGQQPAQQGNRVIDFNDLP